jgi:hypothetical protein
MGREIAVLKLKRTVRKGKAIAVEVRPRSRRTLKDIPENLVSWRFRDRI